MDNTVPEKLRLLRERIADRIGESRYRTWFGDTTELRLREEAVHVVVRNPFAQTWISTNYLPDLVTAAREVLGEAGTVRVQVSSNVPPAAAPASRFAARERQRSESVPSNGQAAHPIPGSAPPSSPARRTLRGELESLVVGPSNQLAFAAAGQLIRAPGREFSVLVVHGRCGLGKTHMLQGICNGLAREHPTLNWRYLSGEEFTNEFIQAVRGGNIDAFRARFRHVDVLVIDDIHFVADKRATQNEFLHTYNAIDAAGKAVVLSCDRHPRALDALAEPLQSRLISGIVVEIEPPDFGMRREILRRRLAAIALDVADEVIDYVAEHVTRNVRELEGAVYKLRALASLTRDGITLELARNAVADYATQARRAPTVPEIEQAVVTHFGVSREQIHSRSRDRSVSLARAIAMYLVRKNTALSFPEIGRLMGHKNHSTVLMATQRIEQGLLSGAEVSWKTAGSRRSTLLRELVASLERRLSEPG